ncbi:hypothetical protein ONZ45_g17255 [Pleurotus djamor]|nr:hypothetical protein ONZ45_g17255 [Pleurotus djamor]
MARRRAAEASQSTNIDLAAESVEAEPISNQFDYLAPSVSPNGLNLEVTGERFTAQITDEIPQREHQVDDIAIEFHPHSKKAPRLSSFEDFKRHTSDLHADASTIPPHSSPQLPWSPFQTRLDFEAASLALDAGLKEEHVKVLIDLMKRCQDGEKFSLNSPTQINELWDSVSHRGPEFVNDVIKTEYDGEVLEFDLWYRPLWDWIASLAKDPKLAPHFEWNSQRLYKFDGEKFVRFFDEPWTGELLWAMESALPENGTPFFVMVYADKSKLSSFGAQKAYPVIARCVNLYSDVRNSREIGSGACVGWFPIVDEDSNESGKQKFIILKNRIWHLGMAKIFESVKDASFLGKWLQCARIMRKHVL